MANANGYTAISVKPEQHQQLLQWQFVIQAKLGRRINLTESLKLALELAQNHIDELHD